MKKEERQRVEFSSLLFDTYFGLLLYFTIEKFLIIGDPLHFAFYLWSTVFLIHWWLLFKSADDAFGREVSDSTADLLFGIVYVVFIQLAILFAAEFDYIKSALFVILLLAVDLAWALIWRYAGPWETTRDRGRIAFMEHELDANIATNAVMIPLFSALLGINHFNPLTPLLFVVIFVFLYALYIMLTYRHKILNLDLF